MRRAAPFTSVLMMRGKDVGLEVGLAEKFIDFILEDSEIKMSEMAEKLEVTTRTIERKMKKLRESGLMKEIFDGNH